MPVHSTLGRTEPRIRCHLQANQASLLEKESIRLETMYTTLQILESWIHMAQQMLKRVAERVTELVKAQKFEKARIDCYLIERIWKLLFKTKFLLEFGFGFVCVCVCVFFFFWVCVWLTRKVNFWVCVCFCVWLTRKGKKIL